MNAGWRKFTPRVVAPATGTGQAPSPNGAYPTDEVMAEAAIGSGDRVGPVEVAAPSPPGALVARAGLLARLDGVVDRPLTLVTAPAGYGKTTLAAQWCAERCPVPSTWWSVDDAAALEHLPALLPDSDGPQVVVIDGLGGDDAAPALAGLVDGLTRHRAPATPAKVHLLVLTRSPLGPDLARLRLDGRLDVLHERDLRLDATELARLVESRTGAAPSSALAQVICDELGGWMAGAVLLALDWDRSATVENHRARLDAGYRSIRTLLAATTTEALGVELAGELRALACLPELHAELIDGITGRVIGDHLIDAIQRTGVFATPSEYAPGGLTVHPLVRAALRDGRPGPTTDEAATLEAASSWCAARNLPVLAAVCRVELGQYDEAIELVEEHLLELYTTDRVRDLGGFLGRIPGPVLKRRFSWMMNLAWTAHESGDTGSMLTIIAAANHQATAPQLIVSSATATLAVSRLEDPTPIIDAAERALALCDEVGEEGVDYGDVYTVSRTAHWRDYLRCGALVGSTYLGDWARAVRHDVEIDPASAIEVPAGVLMIHRGRRATYLALTGQLGRAEREARTALAFAPAHDRHADRAAFPVWFALAEWSRNRFLFEQAADELDRSLERSRASKALNMLALVAAASARLRIDMGRPDEALRILAEHATTGHRPPAGIVALLTAVQGRALDLTGAAGPARQVLEQAPPTAVVQSVRALGALERGDAAEVERLVVGWPEEPTVTSRVHRDLAAAALGEMRGNRRTAAADLRRALVEAHRNDLLLPVRDFGVHVLHLLRAEARDGSDSTGAAALAELVAGQIDRASSAAVRLTPRETLVLHHLADGVTLPELADKLRVSKNTIKSQLRSVYRKLGVSGREEAVRVWRASSDGA